MLFEQNLLKFKQILEIKLKILKVFKKILKVFKKILIKIWKNLTKNWNFSTIDSHSLSSKRFVLGQRSPGFPWSSYCICFSKKLGGGARRMIELFFKIRGTMSPALPVADPMLYSTLMIYSILANKPKWLMPDGFWIRL